MTTASSEMPGQHHPAGQVIAPPRRLQPGVANRGRDADRAQTKLSRSERYRSPRQGCTTGMRSTTTRSSSAWEVFKPGNLVWHTQPDWVAAMVSPCPWRA